MNNYGFVKCAVASPKLKIANPKYNAKEILELILEAQNRKTQILVFPELSLTGYTCGDLFNQKLLIDKALEELKKLMKKTKEIDILNFIGVPIPINGGLYNCVVALQYGEIKGIVPKIHLPNYKEFYEKRWFASGKHLIENVEAIDLFGEKYPFGNLIFENRELGYKVGVEICEDLWSPIPQSGYLSLNGANIIVNLSASNELVAKADYRNQLVRQQSATTICGYAYSSAGVHESTTDIVFSGDCMVYENGNLLNRSDRFKRNNQIIYADIDIDRIMYERRVNKTFSNQMEYVNCCNYKFVKVDGQRYEPDIKDLDRKIFYNPFIPSNSMLINERCEEIFNIQVAGLAKRLEHTNIKHAVIGVSGGLDSTLALLVAHQTFNLLGIPSKNILGVTMPGFGTTENTYNSAVNLMKTMNVGIKEIDIKAACIHHFNDIDHNIEKHDVIYENVQARERTQILMDLANKINGLVIGTGDLSEMALGWSTYNGDHMSMYAVNCSVPKTLVKFLVRWVADNRVSDKAKDILHNIINTPISPELLPPDKNGEIVQKTENIIGPYELHDFFLYHMIRHGIQPQKMLFIGKKAFEGRYSEKEIKKYLKMFYKRFFTQQFKRSCIPDGPKVGSVSLSPRGDWRMPSDADFEIWIEEL